MANMLAAPTTNFNPAARPWLFAAAEAQRLGEAHGEAGELFDGL